MGRTGVCRILRENAENRAQAMEELVAGTTENGLDDDAVSIGCTWLVLSACRYCLNEPLGSAARKYKETR